MTIDEYNKSLKMKVSDEKIKEMKEKLFKMLSIDRQRLIISLPFTGNLSMHFDIVPIRDARVRTACTDGNTIYFDLDFGLNKLKNKERMFVLAHEVWHCVMLHFLRRGTRDPKIWNFATDMEVNNLLVNQNSSCNFQAPDSLLFPPNEMKGKSAEVIYDWLLKEAKKNSKPNNGSGGGSKKKNNGVDTGSFEGQFDKHRIDDDSSSDFDGNSANRIKDSFGEVGFDREYTPKLSKDYADKMREILTSEAQRYERTKGNLPTGLEDILKEIKKPEVNWKEELCKFVTSCHGDKKVWTPPRRSMIWSGLYEQSSRGDKLKVACMVDTSGSCWNDLSKFFGELIGLMKTFTNYELTIVQCDCDVQHVDKYDENNPFPIDDPKSIDISGAGGSSFVPAQKYIRENGIENEVDCIIGFTDGYIDVEKYPPSKQILWILTKDSDKNFCDYGKKIILKTSE